MVPPKGTIWTPHLSSGRGRPALSAPSCSALHTALILLLNSRETSQDLASRIDVVRHSFQMSKDFVPLCASNNSIPYKDRRWMKRSGCSDWAPPQCSKNGYRVPIHRRIFLFRAIWGTRPGFHMLLELQNKDFLNLNLLLLLHISLCTIIITYTWKH